MRYRIFDPTGNITALVEDTVDVSQQPSVAAAIMQKHPNVEQVGFVTLGGDLPALRMAGGEFCGNASMSAAALIAMEQNLSLPATVQLRVSGAPEAVAVRLEQREGETFLAAVRMPAARSTQKQPFTFADLTDDLTVVQMDGISHILIEPKSPFFALLTDHAAAESAVRQWCATTARSGC